MSYVNEALKDIRAQIAADDFDLAEARHRRDLTRKLANLFPGSLATFQSGSLAHGTVNDPVSDADCAVVLDSDEYPTLGPDSAEDEPPSEVVESVREFVRERIGEHGYPDAYFLVTKRAIKIFFRSPLPSGNDPTADLVVALGRRNGRGYWIPNLDQGRWDASDPKGHVEMLRLPDEKVARLRRRIIRLAKAWNKQDSEPGLSSFNITALALERINETMSEAEALWAFFDHAARELERHFTPDPAGVSGNLKLLKDRDTALGRLRRARDNMREALDASDECEAKDAVQRVFWRYELPIPSGKARVAATLASGASSPEIAPRPTKPVRSHGQATYRVGGKSSAKKWFHDRAAFNRAMYGFHQAYPQLRTGRVRRDGTIHLVISGQIEVPYYSPLKVEVDFGAYSDPREPRVTVDGPSRSPHRNGDGSLCVWYRNDPPDAKWMLDDGLVALLDLIKEHLFKEAWWREHGQWPGREAPHAA